MEEEHKEQTNITTEVQEPVISETERRKRLREILRLVAQKLRQKEIVNNITDFPKIVPEIGQSKNMMLTI